MSIRSQREGVAVAAVLGEHGSGATREARPAPGRPVSGSTVAPPLRSRTSRSAHLRLDVAEDLRPAARPRPAKAPTWRSGTSRRSASIRRAWRAARSRGISSADVALAQRPSSADPLDPVGRELELGRGGRVARGRERCRRSAPVPRARSSRPGRPHLRERGALEDVEQPGLRQFLPRPLRAGDTGVATRHSPRGQANRWASRHSGCLESQGQPAVPRSRLATGLGRGRGARRRGGRAHTTRTRPSWRPSARPDRRSCAAPRPRAATRSSAPRSRGCAAPRTRSRSSARSPPRSSTACCASACPRSRA